MYVHFYMRGRYLLSVISFLYACDSCPSHPTGLCMSMPSYSNYFFFRAFINLAKFLMFCWWLLNALFVMSCGENGGFKMLQSIVLELHWNQSLTVNIKKYIFLVHLKEARNNTRKYYLMYYKFHLRIYIL